MRVAELRSLIAQSATSSTINALDDASSPQAMAVNWLASNSFSETLPDERLLQRFALATFAFSTSNAAGLRKNRELSVVEWLSGPEEDEVRMDCKELMDVLLGMLFEQLIVCCQPNLVRMDWNFLHGFQTSFCY